MSGHSDTKKIGITLAFFSQQSKHIEGIFVLGPEENSLLVFLYFFIVTIEGEGNEKQISHCLSTNNVTESC
jgi:hypothetical protein